LHLGLSNHELSFKVFFYGLNQLIFPPKWCHLDLASICHFLVLNPHLKAMGPIYGSHPIRSLYLIGPWTLNPHLKWPLQSPNLFAWNGMFIFSYFQNALLAHSNGKSRSTSKRNLLGGINGRQVLGIHG